VKHFSQISQPFGIRFHSFYYRAKAISWECIYPSAKADGNLEQASMITHFAEWY
jgi:hypothetical protein